MKDSLIGIAAALITKSMSDIQDDYPKYIPKWLVRRIEKHNEFLKDCAVQLRKIHDEQKSKKIEDIQFTRLEVIEIGSGRQYVSGNNIKKVEFSVQDDGKTLKIFVEKNKNFEMTHVFAGGMENFHCDYPKDK